MHRTKGKWDGVVITAGDIPFTTGGDLVLTTNQVLPCKPSLISAKIAVGQLKEMLGLKVLPLQVRKYQTSMKFQKFF